MGIERVKWVVGGQKQKLGIYWTGRLLGDRDKEEELSLLRLLPLVFIVAHLSITNGSGSASYPRATQPAGLMCGDGGL